MHRRGYSAGRGGRVDNVTVPGERPVKFDTHFQVDFVIPIERDMPASTHNFLRAYHAPDRAARVWNDLGEFVRAGPEKNDRKGTTGDMFDPDVVLHLNHRVGVMSRRH